LSEEDVALKRNREHVSNERKEIAVIGIGSDAQLETFDILIPSKVIPIRSESTNQ
jgi:hypothetical protein